MRSFLENSLFFLIIIFLLLSNFKNKRLINLNIESINLSVYTDYTVTLEEGVFIYSDKPLVLLGHSGIGPNAVFNELFYLEIGDSINISIKNKKYTYKLNEISSFKKGAKLKIFNDSDYLYLITCDLTNMQKQWLFSSKLTKIEEI